MVDQCSFFYLCENWKPSSLRLVPFVGFWDWYHLLVFELTVCIHALRLVPFIEFFFLCKILRERDKGSWSFCILKNSHLVFFFFTLMIFLFWLTLTVKIWGNYTLIVIHKEIFWGQINISAISLTHSLICFNIEVFFFFYSSMCIFLVGLI